MSNERLVFPGAKVSVSAPQQVLFILSPPGGVENDFRAILDGNATDLDVRLVLPGERRVVPIRLRIDPVTILPDTQLRTSVFIFGNAYWWETDDRGEPVHGPVTFNDGIPTGNGVRRCNGDVNLQVTQHDTVLGKMRTRL